MGHAVTFPACNHVGKIPRFFYWHKLHFRRSFRRPWLMAIDLLQQLKPELMSIGVEDFKRLKFNHFRRHFLPEIQTDAAHLQNHYDVLVFGSDQIWNIKRSRNQLVDESGYFLGEAVSSGLPKIGYAVSIGEEGTTADENRRIRNAARQMDFLSMREDGACAGLYTRRGVLANWVLDPTLLLRSEDYRIIANPSHMLREKYIVVYHASGRERQPFLDEIVADVRRSTNWKVITLMMYQYGLMGIREDDRTAFGPSDFLAWIRDAEAVISVSFHGTAFSIIYNKPFISILGNDRGIESRQASLLKRLGCEERMVIQRKSDVDVVEQLTTPISATVNLRLDSLREKSRKWLEHAVNGVKAK